MPPILDAPRAFQQLLPAAGQLSGRMPGSAVDKLQRPGTGSAVRSLSTPFRKTPVGRAETTAAITAIWQRHLRRSPIRPDENFFDLGGDSLLAIAVFLEIAAATGRELPITTIYDAPTIDALAALLEDERTPQYCPLVLLKPGADMAPLFIVHGLGGNVVEILPLANRIETPRPIYGIQARGVDGVDLPCRRVEDMAQAYLDAIKTVQPSGPYFLAGYSFGGLVAFEMAHRLSTAGEEVALLALLDSYPHAHFWPLACRGRVLGRLAKHHARAAIDLGFGQLVPYARQRAASLTTYFAPWRGAHRRRSSAAYLSAPRSLQQVLEQADIARAQYRPRFYPGKITFLRAAVCLRTPDDPAAVWGMLAGELEVHTVPGDHREMVRTGVNDLASLVSTCLRQPAGRQARIVCEPDQYWAGHPA